jgi:hypothetical protein
MCRQEFGDVQALVNHVENECWPVHGDELEATAKRRADFHRAPDPEWEAYNDDLRRRGIDPDKQFDRRLKHGHRRLRES